MSDATDRIKKNAPSRTDLSRFYPDMNADDVRDRFWLVSDGLSSVFGAATADAPRFFSAPGRTELLGNHTDHQNGLVIAAAVNLDNIAAATPSAENVIRVFSETYGITSVSLNDLSPRENDTGTHAALVRGVAEYLTQRGYRLTGGFNAYTSGQVPAGSGLSSSAAFEVLTAVILNGLYFNGAIPTEVMAQAGQYAENVHFGKPCGLMDQMASAVGGIISIDFMNSDAPKTTRLAVDFSKFGYALCVIDTGAKHDQLGSEYAAIPAEMSDVAGCLGAEKLREVDPVRFYDALPELRNQVTDRALLRAAHYFEENERVQRAQEALGTGDFETYLRLVRESGRSSWKLLQNIYPGKAVRDQSAALTLFWCERLLNGTGACRIHGGGFGGTIQAYVPVDAAQRFKEQMEQLTGFGSCRFLKLRDIGASEILCDPHPEQ